MMFAFFYLLIVGAVVACLLFWGIGAAYAAVRGGLLGQKLAWAKTSPYEPVQALWVPRDTPLSPLGWVEARPPGYRGPLYVSTPMGWRAI